MKTAFIDTSALAAILFDEPGSSGVRKILADLGSIYASNLLEAEIRSAAAREKVDQGEVDEALSGVKWVQMDRPLSHELKSLVSVGFALKGADLWHLACALYLAGDPSTLPFITLDRAQAQAAARLGFKVLPGAMPSHDGVKDPQAAYKAKKPRVKVGKKN